MPEHDPLMAQIHSHLRVTCNLEADKIAALLPGFLDALSVYAGDLETAMGGRDSEALARAAHRLKGALANLGLAGLAEEARLIEQRARQQDSSGHVREITGQAHGLLKKVRTLANGNPSRTGG